jgi:hypothetical protein
MRWPLARSALPSGRALLLPGESESGDPEVPGAMEPISVLTRPCPNERVQGTGRSGFDTRIARAPSGLA